MKKAQMVSLVFCGALLALVLSCASTGGGKVVAHEGVWDWQTDNDASNGGTSTITMTEGTEGGITAYSFAGTITNEYQYGDVYVKVYPAGDMLDLLKTMTAVSFKVKGDGDAYMIKIPTSNITDYAYYQYSFDTVDGQEMLIIVPMAYFMQASWGKTEIFDQSLAEWIEFQTTRSGAPGPYEFKLWDLKLYTGGIPTQNTKTKKAAPAAAAKGVGGDLGAMAFKLLDNFQYGDGYQGVFSDKRLFNGHKLVPGETFTLKITYTTSRDLEDIVQVGLVDTTPAASYWKPLSWLGDEGMAEIPTSKAGEKVSVTLTFTTVAEATGSSGAANALVFLTKGEGKKGTPNSGAKKSVTLDFTEFVFTQE
ncbi:MAG: CIA30 family protein [Treponema sp.]|jgi:hypothetical protein|nr:CIA30 family protein [Treponema sp.]